MLLATVLTALVAVSAGAVEIDFGAKYEGDYDPRIDEARPGRPNWTRGTSTLPILPNQDGDRPATGVATFDDNRQDGRIQLSVPLRKAFGADASDKEYSFELRARFHLQKATMGYGNPPFAVAVVGFRDEDSATSFGRPVLLGFFVDIDPGQAGLQPGLGLADENARLVKEVKRLNFCDDLFHTYTVEKYLVNGAARVRVRTDGGILAEDIDYSAFPPATRNTEGFGYFTSTGGTIKSSVALLRFGGAGAKAISGLKIDSRDIENGLVILQRGYSDQPYLIGNSDGSLTCLLTISDVGEGAGVQRVVSLRSVDAGRTWSDPVALEPDGSPENSWAVPVLTDNGRIYTAYTFNHSNLRSIKMENSEFSSRVDSLGKFVFRYSDDQGRSWSKERFEIPIRLTDFDRTNIYRGDVNEDGQVDGADARFFWSPSRAAISRGAVYLGITKIRNFRPIGVFAETEGFLLKSENLLTEPNAASIRWEMLPEGQFGLRSRNGETCEETTPLSLSDGTMVALCRTTEGVILGFYSVNGGKSWSSPEPLRYALDNRLLKNPRAKPALWRLRGGQYLLWFANNGHTGFEARNPAWVAVGEEREGRLLFSQPEILLFSKVDAIRMSYPDLIEHDGKLLISETQKSVARLHRVDDALIQGLLGQSRNRQVAQNALGATWRRGDSRKLKLQGDLNAAEDGSSLEFWLKHTDWSKEKTVISAAGGESSDISVVTTPTGEVILKMKRGPVEFTARSDEGSLRPNAWNHVVCIVEAGPRIVMWVVNGRLSDGGSKRAAGWTRYPVAIGPPLDPAAVNAGVVPRDVVQLVRYYYRPLRVSEAIANFNAGYPR